MVSLGPLLTEIARSIVIGKLQKSAWVTRSAKLSSAAETPHDLQWQRQAQ
ncbi:Hypothetical protein FKW44_002217 [Caligus rogercresseyi]|uniref:Uncharacterized protein n=1 Tax=Caligus rogercresseyi TaxID=217165 RepID=A0A7T8QW48_CALRO|nr:Hypothetical protein FKW44_002217 [Caligus rogercresseyi]